MTGQSAAGHAQRLGDRVRLPFARRMGLGSFLRDTAKQARKDSLSAHAGNLTYRGMFALIPTLVALLWTMRLLHAGWLVNDLTDLMTEALPKAASGPVKAQLSQVTGEGAGPIPGFGYLAALSVAVWACTDFFRALTEALNAMYAVKESRSVLKRYALSFSLSIAVGALLAGALFFVLFGASLAANAEKASGLGPAFSVLWTALTWVALVAAVFFAFGLVYYFAPNLEQRVAWVSKGTAIAVGLWLLFALGFSLYADEFANYSQVYGALAGVAVLLTYLYATYFILLLGAELNQVITFRRADRERQRQAAQPAAVG